MGHEPERSAIRREVADSSHSKLVRNVGAGYKFGLATIDWNPHEMRYARAIDVVHPLPIRRTHRVRLKGTGGELLRDRTIRVGAPDVDVLAAMICPRKNNILIAAGCEVE